MTIKAKKYKYLLWDIDRTVLGFEPAEHAALNRLFIAYGFGELTPDRRVRYNKINQQYWADLDKHLITKQEVLVNRFRDFFRMEGLPEEKAAEFNNDYQVALSNTIIFTDNVLDVITEAKKNYIQCAVTNGTRLAQKNKLHKSGLDQIFNYIFISDDVGYDKPEIEFFNYVFDTINVTDKSEVLIIGDSINHDILGGVNSGIDTCWYNPYNVINESDITPTYEIKNHSELKSILF